MVLESLALTAVYEDVEDGWVQARIEELPEVITAAPDIAEAKSMLGNALREYLLSLAQDSERLPAAAGAIREPLGLELTSA